MEKERESGRVAYLRSIASVRETCKHVYTTSQGEDCLKHFTVDTSKLEPAADFVLDVIKKSYPGDVSNVPFHSRWRHFEAGNSNRVTRMCAEWTCDDKEKARRFMDLALVSVLLDAGAGPDWKYKEPKTNDYYSRSEGLGVASFHMFLSGAFSTDKSQRADASALKNLSEDAVASAFQVDEASNPLVGCSGRTELLKRLGDSLMKHPEFFYRPEDESYRPGNMVDYLFSKAKESKVSVMELWKVVIYGLEEIWPATRTTIDGFNMGDVWELPHVPPRAESGSFVSFHKLSQWVTYSLMEPLQSTGLGLDDLQLMTGLPEYRNGGLLVDLGVLVPKQEEIWTKAFQPSDTVIIEWRALTVALLDELHAILLKKVNLTPDVFPLVKMLEGGSWKAGRVIAKEKREGGGPPIMIDSDGTVF